MSRDVALMSATDLLRHFRRGTLSPVEATKAALGQVRQHNERLNALCWLDEEGALVQARESEVRWRDDRPMGLLDGVPATVKDLLLTKGWPTLRGSRTVKRDQPWTEDAPTVARLREHGAVLIGKTTTPEFGWKGVTDSPLTGITRNPWDPSKTPGGSSGGAAVAANAPAGAAAPSPPRPAWVRFISAPTAAAPSASLPPSPASSASSRASGACRPIPLAPSARSPMSGR